MSRKAKREKKRMKQPKVAGEGDQNDSRAANIGRKRKRNDDAIDTARQELKRAKIDADLDYVPLHDAGDSATDEDTDGDSGLESGEVDSSDSPGQSDVVTRSRSATSTSGATSGLTSGSTSGLTLTPASTQLNDHPEVAGMKPRWFRDEVNSLLTQHAGWSILQALEHLMAHHAKTPVRRRAQRACNKWRRTQSDPQSQGTARSMTAGSQSNDHQTTNEDSSLESGEVESNDSPGHPNVVTQQRSRTSTDKSTLSQPDVRHSADIDVASVMPIRLRRHAEQLQQRHPDWSLYQILRHVEQHQPSDKLRQHAKLLLAGFSEERISASPGAATTSLPEIPDMFLEDVQLDKLRKVTQAVQRAHSTWSAHTALKFVEITSASPKMRKAAAGAFRSWYKRNCISSEARTSHQAMLREHVVSHTATARGLHDQQRSAVFKAAPINLDEIEPPPLQAALRLHMRTSESGLTPEAAMRKVLEEGDKAFKKFATRALKKQHHGCVRRINTLYDIDLAQVVTGIEHFRAEFDVAALCAVTDHSEDSREKSFGKLLHKRCTEWPGTYAAEHLFNLMCAERAPDTGYHILACEAMSCYLSNNLIKAQVPNGDSGLNGQRSAVSVSDHQEPERQQSVERATAGKGPTLQILESSDDASQHVPSVLEREIYDRTIRLGDLEPGKKVEPLSAVSTDFLRLSDLSTEDQALQYRYFGLSDLGDSPFCLCCGEQGHHESTCPATVCQHCSSSTHFSRRCPSHQKCERCRQRGHSSLSCSNHSRIAGAPGDECDVCGRTGHAEEECAGLWTTFEVDLQTFARVPRESMIVSCYNCGKANDHWGDDCKSLPDYVIKDIMHDTWSAANADRYILGSEKATKGQRDISAADSSIHDRDGGIQAHQLAQLGDWL